MRNIKFHELEQYLSVGMNNRLPLQSCCVLVKSRPQTIFQVNFSGMQGVGKCFLVYLAPAWKPGFLMRKSRVSFFKVNAQTIEQKPI